MGVVHYICYFFMTVTTHILFFLIGLVAIWISAGHLIDIVSRLAHRFHRSSFVLSFFVLGVLTSISEISVAVNATAEGAPQISAGNLIGASLVIILLIIPLLAMFGNGIRLSLSFSRGSILLAGITIVLPPLLILDGNLNLFESIGLLVFYAALLLAIEKRTLFVRTARALHNVLPRRGPADARDTVFDVIKLIVGAAIIFIAARALVHQTLFFSDLLDIPSSFIALLALSLGTNVPELVIAARSVMKKQKEIAFGDYMGSAATNTLIFACLGLVNGGFMVERTEFIPVFCMLAFGLILFIVFCNSNRIISRAEGWGLFTVYCMYLLWQFGNLTRFLTS